MKKLNKKTLEKNKLKLGVKLNVFHDLSYKKPSSNNIHLSKYGIMPKPYFKNHISNFIKTYSDQSYIYFKDHPDLFKNHILDLHGYCQEAARALVHIFFKHATKKGFEYIIIITGPGPILKNMVLNLITQNKFQIYLREIKDLGGSIEIILK